MNAPDAMSHERAAELLPWLVNDSLGVDEKDSVLAHARACVICRRDLDDLQKLKDVMSRVAAPIPAPDMRNINARIDALIERRGRARHLLSWLGEGLRSPWRTAFVAQSVLLIVLAVMLLLPASDDGQFGTLTDADELPEGHYLRVVFSPELQRSELSELLERFGLEVIDGPTSRGVYTLALPAGLSPNGRDELTAQLQRDSRILFAQPPLRGVSR